MKGLAQGPRQWLALPTLRPSSNVEDCCVICGFKNILKKKAQKLVSAHEFNYRTFCLDAGFLFKFAAFFFFCDSRNGKMTKRFAL